MNQKYVLGIGAANVDITGKSKKELIMKDSNPGFMHVSIGGVTRNVLENIARLKHPCKLISALGNDLYGQMIESYSSQAGIDMSNCLHVDNTSSSTYLAILNNNGDMHLALSDMHIIDNITVDILKNRFDLIRNAEVITFDPCLKEEVIDFICRECSKYARVFCDPVSSAYAGRLKPYVGYVDTLKPNEMELAILAEHEISNEFDMIQACRILTEKGVRRIFVSRGSKGCMYYDRQGHLYFKHLKPVEDMVNASGAGDSFMAGVIYSYVNGFNTEKTIDYALACGIAAINSEMTINPDLGIEMIEKIIERG
ncbi:MAG: carbohydrate kinase family protein [Erysipelotrichaceae bacterium]|nr:carbohydrate kinase family protein [Erysipelotrichaceae bacterium]